MHSGWRDCNLALSDRSYLILSYSRISGALYGRSAGEGMLILYKDMTGNDSPLADDYFKWIDPGFIAILGAGSLLAGVQRLTLSTTVMIVS